MLPYFYTRFAGNVLFFSSVSLARNCQEISNYLLVGGNNATRWKCHFFVVIFLRSWRNFVAIEKYICCTAEDFFCETVTIERNK